jgi:tetratricopeptide (TPR) repeat protein
MFRLLTGVLLFVVAGVAVIGQSNSAPAPQRNAGSAQLEDSQPDKANVLRLIALNEAAARQGEATHADRKRLVMIYSNLGVLYGDAAMYLKAEDAVRRAVVLLKDGPQDQLAEQIEQLAVLHVAMHKLGLAEKDEMQDMQIREAVGDPVGIAIAQNSLAGLYDEEQKFGKALGYAQKAYDVLADRTEVSAVDRIGVRQTLGFAMTGSRNCDRGIELLKDAMELAKTSAGVSDMKVGYSEYLLGFGYWHCGDRTHASEWLERGSSHMRSDYGWDHALYVNAMTQYARFLRENGQREAAVTVEAVVNQAESVVDAGALTGRTEGLRSAGSR